MPWEELLSLLSKANCTLRTIDLSGYALTEQNLRDLLAIFKKNRALQKIIWGAVPNDEKIQLLRNEIEEQLKFNSKPGLRLNHLYPENYCFHQIFENMAQSYSADPAVIPLPNEAEKVLTYQQLNKRANQLARYFLDVCQLKPGDKIGIFLEQSSWMIVSILAAMKAGIVFVLLDSNQDKTPDIRLREYVDQCAPKMIFTQKSFQSREFIQSLSQTSSSNGTGNVNIKLCYQEEIKNEIKRLSVTNLDQKIDPESISYIIFSSGSTGNPKGIEVKYAGLRNALLSHQDLLLLTKNDRIAQMASMAFDASLMEIMMALGVGASLYLVPRDLRFTDADLANFYQKNAITVGIFVPSFLRTLKPGSFPHFRVLLSTGEALNMQLIKMWCQYDRSMMRIFVNGYGPSEVTIVTAIVICMLDSEVVVVGKPILGLETRIMDIDNPANEVQAGKSGELCISGVGVAKGYIGNQRLTDEKFVEGGIWYRTGDIANYDEDGFIVLHGRLDRQLKVYGQMVCPEEIETQLRNHRFVSNAFVHKIPYQFKDEKEINYHLVAHVMPSAGCNLEQEELSRELMEYLFTRLPKYMVPARWVVRNDLPLNRNDKIDIPKLTQTPSKPIFVRFEAMRHPNPGSEEELVLKIWRDVLDIDNSFELSIHDNFFYIGGDSTRYKRIEGILRDYYKQYPALYFDIKEFVKNPTISAMAKRIRKTKQPNLISPIKKNDNTNLSPYFLFPSVFGDPDIDYNEAFYNCLSKNRPVYSFCMYKDNDKDMYDTHEEIGEEYGKHILSYQPAEPIVIIGYSSGANIADAVGRWLLQRNHKVYVFLIDPISPLLIQKLSDKEHAEQCQLLINIAKKLYAITLIRGLSTEELCKAKSKKDQISHISDALKSALNVPIEKRIEIEKQLDYMRQIKISELNYKPQHYELDRNGSKFILMTTSGSIRACNGDPLLGWGKLTNEAIQIPGDTNHCEAIAALTNCPRFHELLKEAQNLNLQVWNLPVTTKRFVPRSEEVQVQKRLAKKFDAKSECIYLVLHGESGVGKTQLASLIVNNYTNYNFRIWFDATNPEQLTQAYINFGRAFNIIGINLSYENAVNEVIAWLEKTPGWLLVIDNLNTEQPVKLPRKGGTVLITSTASSWPDEWKLSITEMSESNAIALCKNILGPRTNNDEKLLIDKIGRSPLVVTLASEYIKCTNDVTIKTYLRKFADDRPITDTRQAVDQVLKITLEILQQSSKEAEYLAIVCSYLDGINLYDGILEQFIKENHQLVAKSSLGNALKFLKDYAILLPATEREQGFWKIHALLQDSIRNYDHESYNYNILSEDIMPRLSTIYPLTGHTCAAYDTRLKLIPHFEQVLTHAELEQFASYEETFYLVTTCNRLLADAYGVSGKFDKQNDCFNRAYEIWQQFYIARLGQNCIDYALTISSFAAVSGENESGRITPLLTEVQNILHNNGRYCEVVQLLETQAKLNRSNKHQCKKLVEQAFWYFSQYSTALGEDMHESRLYRLAQLKILRASVLDDKDEKEHSLLEARTHLQNLDKVHPELVTVISLLIESTNEKMNKINLLLELHDVQNTIQNNLSNKIPQNISATQFKLAWLYDQIHDENKAREYRAKAITSEKKTAALQYFSLICANFKKLVNNNQYGTAKNILQAVLNIITKITIPLELVYDFFNILLDGDFPEQLNNKEIRDCIMAIKQQEDQINSIELRQKISVLKGKLKVYKDKNKIIPANNEAAELNINELEQEFFKLYEDYFRNIIGFVENSPIMLFVKIEFEYSIKACLQRFTAANSQIPEIRSAYQEMRKQLSSMYNRFTLDEIWYFYIKMCSLNHYKIVEIDFEIIEELTKLSVAALEKTSLLTDRIDTQTQHYYKLLYDARDKFCDAIKYDSAITQEQIELFLQLQANYSEEITSILRSIINDCLTILGQAPCKFYVSRLGSLGNGGFTLFSDVDYMLVLVLDDNISDGQRKIIDNYFKLFISLFESKIKLFREYGMNGCKNGMRIDKNNSPKVVNDTIKGMYGTIDEIISKHTGLNAIIGGYTSLYPILNAALLYPTNSTNDNVEFDLLLNIALDEQFMVVMGGISLKKNEEFAVQQQQSHLSVLRGHLYSDLTQQSIFDIKDMFCHSILFMVNDAAIYHNVIATAGIALPISTNTMIKLLENNNHISSEFAELLQNIPPIVAIIRLRSQNFYQQQLKPELVIGQHVQLSTVQSQLKSKDSLEHLKNIENKAYRLAQDEEEILQIIKHLVLLPYVNTVPCIFDGPKVFHTRDPLLHYINICGDEEKLKQHTFWLNKAVKLNLMSDRTKSYYEQKIAYAISQSVKPQLVELLNRSNEILDLTNIIFDDKCINTLSNLLKDVDIHYTKIIIGECSLSYIGADTFEEFVKRCHRLVECVWTKEKGDCRSNHLAGMQTVILNNCKRPNFQNLLTKHVVDLDLSSFIIDDYDMVSFCAQIDLGSCSLQKIIFKQFKLTNKTTKLFFSKLSKCQNLISVEWGENDHQIPFELRQNIEALLIENERRIDAEKREYELSQKAEIELTEKLISSGLEERLTTSNNVLDLSDVIVNDNCIHKLLTLIYKYNTPLSTIIICGNRITDDGVYDLISIINRCKSIIHIKLSTLVISYEQKAKIAEALQNNVFEPTIKILGGYLQQHPYCHAISLTLEKQQANVCQYQFIINEFNDKYKYVFSSSLARALLLRSLYKVIKDNLLTKSVTLQLFKSRQKRNVLPLFNELMLLNEQRHTDYIKKIATGLQNIIKEPVFSLDKLFEYVFADNKSEANIRLFLFCLLQCIHLNYEVTSLNCSNEISAAINSNIKRSFDLVLNRNIDIQQQNRQNVIDNVLQTNSNGILDFSHLDVNSDDITYIVRQLQNLKSPVRSITFVRITSAEKDFDCLLRFLEAYKHPVLIDFNHNIYISKAILDRFNQIFCLKRETVIADYFKKNCKDGSLFVASLFGDQQLLLLLCQHIKAATNIYELDLTQCQFTNQTLRILYDEIKVNRYIREMKLPHLYMLNTQIRFDIEQWLKRNRENIDTGQVYSELEQFLKNTYDTGNLIISDKKMGDIELSLLIGMISYRLNQKISTIQIDIRNNRISHHCMCFILQLIKRQPTIQKIHVISIGLIDQDLLRQCKEAVHHNFIMARQQFIKNMLSNQVKSSMEFKLITDLTADDYSIMAKLLHEYSSIRVLDFSSVYMSEKLLREFFHDVRSNTRIMNFKYNCYYMIEHELKTEIDQWLKTNIENHNANYIHEQVIIRFHDALTTGILILNDTIIGDVGITTLANALLDDRVGKINYIKIDVINNRLSNSGISCLNTLITEHRSIHNIVFRNDGGVDSGLIFACKISASRNRMRLKRQLNPISSNVIVFEKGVLVEEAIVTLEMIETKDFIRVIDFSDFNPSLAVLTQLVAVLEKIHTIIDVKFATYRIINLYNDPVFEKIRNLLRTNVEKQSREKIMAQLAEPFELATSTGTLQLNGAIIGDNGVKVLLSVLCSNQHSKIQKLHISIGRAMITDVGLTQLIAGLEKCNNIEEIIFERTEGLSEHLINRCHKVVCKNLVNNRIKQSCELVPTLALDETLSLNQVKEIVKMLTESVIICKLDFSRVFWIYNKLNELFVVLKTCNTIIDIGNISERFYYYDKSKPLFVEIENWLNKNKKMLHRNSIHKLFIKYLATKDFADSLNLTEIIYGDVWMECFAEILDTSRAAKISRVVIDVKKSLLTANGWQLLTDLIVRNPQIHDLKLLNAHGLNSVWVTLCNQVAKANKRKYYTNKYNKCLDKQVSDPSDDQYISQAVYYDIVWYDQSHIAAILNLKINEIRGYAEGRTFLLAVSNSDHTFQDNDAHRFSVLVTPPVLGDRYRFPIDYYMDKDIPPHSSTDTTSIVRKDVFDEIYYLLFQKHQHYIKILFPYNIATVEWATVEIKIICSTIGLNDHYTVLATLYNPLCRKKLDTNSFSVLCSTFRKKILSVDHNATFDFKNRAGVATGRTGKNYNSTGVMVIEDLFKLILGINLFQMDQYGPALEFIRKQHSKLIERNYAEDHPLRRSYAETQQRPKEIDSDRMWFSHREYSLYGSTISHYPSNCTVRSRIEQALSSGSQILYLADMNVKDDDIRYLSNMLQYGHKLCEINLENNHLTDVSGELMYEILRRHPQITRLTYHGNAISADRELDISTKIKENYLSSLIKISSNMRYYDMLDLSNRGLVDIDIKFIFAKLPFTLMQRITTIDLSGNFITDTSATLLFDYVKDNLINLEQIIWNETHSNTTLFFPHEYNIPDIPTNGISVTLQQQINTYCEERKRRKLREITTKDSICATTSKFNFGNSLISRLVNTEVEVQSSFEVIRRSTILSLETLSFLSPTLVELAALHSRGYISRIGLPKRDNTQVPLYRYGPLFSVITPIIYETPRELEQQIVPIQPPQLADHHTLFKGEKKINTKKQPKHTDNKFKGKNRVHQQRSTRPHQFKGKNGR